MSASVTIEYDVPARMRDGVVLRADVYRPVGDGPWPVIVARTPYSKSDTFENMFLDPLLAVKHGLIAVIQDVRSRYTSEGDVWVPFATEAEDGADTIAWAAQLEGSSGRVGMWGASYMGNVQWQAASQKPEALRAIAPMITFRTDADGLSMRGGAAELGLGRAWSIATGFDAVMRRHADDEEAMMKALSALAADMDGIPGATYAELPTTGADPVVGRHGLPAFGQGAVPADVSVRQANVDLPALNLGGWFDIFLQGTIDNHVAGGQQSRLIVGPWNHISFLAQQGELNFGFAGNGIAVDGGASIGSLVFDWLHARLTGDVADELAPVKIYTMGAGRWRSEPTWPLERAIDTRYYCVAGGQALVQPPAQPDQASFRYDPRDPVPTVGGGTLMPHAPAGSYDQTRIESRDDVLVFTTPPLLEDVEVTGPVHATLSVSTDAPTTDWVVRLCDLHPDGASYNVTDGISRVATTPGESTRVDVDLWSTSMLFRAGHSIRIHVTSSSFPRWDRNLNTTGGGMQVANQTLHLDGETYITLPVIPLGGEGDI